MRFIFFIALSATIFFTFGSQQLKADTTVSELKRTCEKTMNYNSHARAASNDFEDTATLIYDHAFCTATIDAVVDIGTSVCNAAHFFFASNQGIKRPDIGRSAFFKDGIRLDGNWQYEDLAEMFVNWANDHPQKWNEEGPNGMSMALSLVFPCQAGE